MSLLLLAGRTVGCISGNHQLEGAIPEIPHSKRLAFKMYIGNVDDKFMLSIDHVPLSY